ncbi:uncharacterized protein LOC136037213 isoform X2 [Artemia franciscana]|uniref:uncharacterized protein LOC136037213 isoform X2 n=1 Tax=Artemia franciscana TaxID=6661 RepID=UPI0032DAC8D5
MGKICFLDIPKTCSPVSVCNFLLCLLDKNRICSTMFLFYNVHLVSICKARVFSMDISLTLVYFIFLISQFDNVMAYLQCRQESLNNCTDPLKVVTSNRNLGFATTKEELDSLCPKLLGGLECITNYSRRCLDPGHGEFFHMLYAGTEKVIQDLCLDEEYQKEYLSHAMCMRSVQSGYEQCASIYQDQVHSVNSFDEFDAYDEDTIQTTWKLCCSFRTYIECSQQHVFARCGHETSVFTGSFLDKMAGSLVHGYCLAFDLSQGCNKEEEVSEYDNILSREESLEVRDEVTKSNCCGLKSLPLVIIFWWFISTFIR